MTLTHQAFPNTFIEPFIITSPQTINYNCIAWAYGDDTKWYWPVGNYYWPSEIPCELKTEYFILLFEKIGFRVCESSDLEMGFHKIAIYCDNLGTPTHAARQLTTGKWTSKLGPQHDVEHTIFSMSDGYYGNAGIFMKRKD